jgi:histidinol-phosphate aminotransferase
MSEVASVRELMARWLRPEIAALSAYAVPDATGLIKLDAMENPYRLPDELVEGWLERLRGVALNRYPDPAAQGVKAHLREALGLATATPMLLGNGSDELIQIIIMALAGPQRSVLAPAPSFAMYRMIAIFAGMDYVEVALRGEDFFLDMPAMRAAIERHRPAVIFLAYPNNPTGNLWRRQDVEEIIRIAPGVVVLDEAYAPFASDSFVDRLDAYPNLLLMRTLSKMGLAGLRLGLLLGPRAWLEALDRLRLPYNINVLTQASVEFALAHRAVFEAQAARICQHRQALMGALEGLQGVRVYPSEANFLLFRTLTTPAPAVFEGLRAEAVLIKDLSTQAGLGGCLRVTVGTAEENAAFLAALRRVLGL